jgi:hypothetical protein
MLQRSNTRHMHPVRCFRANVGWTECGDISSPMNTPCRYLYIDLWSRRTTWGGNAPPREGDSVFIPEGNTVRGCVCRGGAGSSLARYVE